MRADRRCAAAALVLLFPFDGVADESATDPETDRETFLSSVMLEAEVEVCVERAPAVGKELLAAFTAWRADRADAIERGEVFVRASDLNGVAFDDYLAHLRSLTVRFYEVALPEEAETMCRALLK